LEAPRAELWATEQAVSRSSFNWPGFKLASGVIAIRVISDVL
jgi:hypothetical protein